MVVRRSDSRRRRVVVDPAIQTAESTLSMAAANSMDTSTSRKRGKYTIGAERRHQNKTTDFIPKRFWSVTIVVALLLAAIVSLNLLAMFAGSWSNRIGTEGVAALRLSGRATLSGWFSSLLLIISGLASLQIYALRQHRRDDYRGSYRLWLWMSMLLMIASLDCVVDLSSIGANLLQNFTAVSLNGESWWPLAIKISLLTMLVARGIFEIRESRGSLALVVFVWVAYAGAALMQQPALDPAMVGVDREMVLGNCFLLGTVGLMLAELTFARFVFLQAHGLIKPRIAKAKKTKTKAASTTEAKPTPSRKTKKASSDLATAADADNGDAIDITDSEPATNKRGKKSSSSKSKPKGAAPAIKLAADTSVSKNNTSDSADAINAEQTDDEDILSMSKSELRRHRKQQQNQHQNQNQRRAA